MTAAEGESGGNEPETAKEKPEQNAEPGTKDKPEAAPGTKGGPKAATGAKDKPKAAQVAKERRRLMKLFADIDENKKDFVKEQIATLAWLTVSVKILQERIDEYGTMIKYDNGGGQSGFKENPDVKTMMNYQKNVNDITRQLTDLVPAKRKESRLAALASVMAE